jgi:hypothetical protein
VNDWRYALDNDNNKQLDNIRNLFSALKIQSTFTEAFKILSLSFEPFVLVGGLSRSFYTSPRNTGDIDLLFDTEYDLKNFLHRQKGNYKQIRPHSIIMKGSEVDLLTSEFLGISSDIRNYVFETAKLSDLGVMVASKEAIILLKLQRLSPTDDNDIRALIEAGGKDLKVNDILRLAKTNKEKIEEILEQSKMFLKE